MAQEHWNPETVAVVAGRDHSPGAPINVPPTFASTFRDGGVIGYGRTGNPTWRAFEDALGELEGGPCVAFSSGLGAVNALLAPLPLGSVVTYPRDGYNGTRQLLATLGDAGRVRPNPIEVTDTSAVLASLDHTDLLWLESPTNPLLGVAELPLVLAAARERGVASVVDNTFATPILQRPLVWGATAVVHSATKYLGGHSDLLLGAVVVGDEGRRDALVEYRTLAGSVPGVMEAYLALRGLRTLPIRMARQQDSAASLAEWLSAHDRVERVRYPGLASDPFHERAVAHMDGFGAMISFDVASAGAADRVVAGLRLIVGTTSLGGVETSIERRSRWSGEEGVPAGLLRLSVGLEHSLDLWRDLDRALTSAGEEA